MKNMVLKEKIRDRKKKEREKFFNLTFFLLLER